MAEMRNNVTMMFDQNYGNFVKLINLMSTDQGWNKFRCGKSEMDKSGSKYEDTDFSLGR